MPYKRKIGAPQRVQSEGYAEQEGALDLHDLANKSEAEVRAFKRPAPVKLAGPEQNLNLTLKLF